MVVLRILRLSEKINAQPKSIYSGQKSASFLCVSLFVCYHWSQYSSRNVKSKNSLYVILDYILCLYTFPQWSPHLWLSHELFPPGWKLYLYQGFFYVWHFCQPHYTLSSVIASIIIIILSSPILTPSSIASSILLKHKFTPPNTHTHAHSLLPLWNA